MKKLIVLDFDGTLADTSEAIIRTFKAAADANGQICESDERIRRSIGLHLRDMYRDLCNISDSEMIQRCIASYLVIFRDYFPYIKLFSEVKETLTQLKTDGYRLAIATNRGADSLVPLMEMLGIEALIDDYVTPESVTNVKPAPDMVELLMNRAGVRPEDTLVVGDTTFDIEMGQHAGCRTCGVTYGSHTLEQLAVAGADCIAEDFSEIRRGLHHNES